MFSTRRVIQSQRRICDDWREKAKRFIEVYAFVKPAVQALAAAKMSWGRKTIFRSLRVKSHRVYM